MKIVLKNIIAILLKLYYIETTREINNCKQQNEANDNNLPYRFQISINEKYKKKCMEFFT